MRHQNDAILFAVDKAHAIKELLEMGVISQYEHDLASVDIRQSLGLPGRIQVAPRPIAVNRKWDK